METRVNCAQQSLGARLRPLAGVIVGLSLGARDGFGRVGGCEARGGQAEGRQRRRELAGGVRSRPRRPPPLEVPVPAPGQPQCTQFTQPFPPTPDTHTHTHTHSHTHSGDKCSGVGGHTVVTQRCARSVWLLTGAQRLLFLGLGRQPWFGEAGKERPAPCGCLYLAVPGAQRANLCHDSGITSPWRAPLSGFPQ